MKYPSAISYFGAAVLTMLGGANAYGFYVQRHEGDILSALWCLLVFVYCVISAPFSLREAVRQTILEMKENN